MKNAWWARKPSFSLPAADGERALPLPSAQDHKRVYDGDAGPNTGGMGAYSPAPILPDDQLEAMAEATVRPILRTLAKDGHPFVGVLYAGLMLTAQGPKVLEYNVRFGDPECQPLLMRLTGDLPAIMLDAVRGRLNPAALGQKPQTALGVVLTAKGYPGAYPKGLPITGIAEAEALPQVKVFHSGTSLKEGQLLSTGGRVLCVTALVTIWPRLKKPPTPPWSASICPTASAAGISAIRACVGWDKEIFFVGAGGMALQKALFWQ